MSKRHQQNRRKSYGRRQHELRQRYERQHLPEPAPKGWDASDAAAIDPLSFFDPRAPRLRFAQGD